jgi:hypothetical protein
MEKAKLLLRKRTDSPKAPDQKLETALSVSKNASAFQTTGAMMTHILARFGE